MKYLPLIWYGIWRKRGRAVLMLLQITIAFVLFGLLQGFKSGVDQTIAKLDADLYLVQRANGWDANAYPMPLSMFEQIRAVPGVRAASYQSVLVGTYQLPTQQVVMLATNIDQAINTVGGIVVSPEAISAMKRTRAGALISRDLAARYRFKVGDQIPLEEATGPGSPKKLWRFEVIGLFEPGENSTNKEFGLINYSYLDEARVADKGTVNAYFARMANIQDGQAVAQSIDKLFANSGEETETQSLREVAQSNFQSIGDLNFLIKAIVGAVLFALLFSIGAMMMKAFRERTPELAVLKTVGFTDRRIFWFLVTEALIQSVFSALMGLVLASVVLPFSTRFIGLTLTMPWSVLLAGTWMAVGLAILGALLPAWRGLRLPVAQALAGR
jgi:putative ABC transport system permease protein